MKYLYIGLIILFFISCKSYDKDFKNNVYDLKEIVAVIKLKWEQGQEKPGKYPYIIIKERNLQNVPNYYIDSNNKLFVDSILNNKFKDFFTKTMFTEIHFYNELYIEFVYEKNTNIIKETSNRFAYIESEISDSSYLKMDETNWYYRVVNITH